MTKRSECQCPCHTNFGCQIVHCIPCCMPDDETLIEKVVTQLKRFDTGQYSYTGTQYQEVAQQIIDMVKNETHP